MKKEFFDDISWGGIIEDTYKNTNTFKPEYSFDIKGRKIVNRKYTNDDIDKDNVLLLDDDLYSICFDKFSGCSNLTGTLIIPDSVEEISGFAFTDCTGFNGKLSFGKSLKEIEESAFNGCSGFTGELILPESLINIYSCAFRNCTGFTGDLRIPESVNYISSSAFENCNFNRIYVPKDKVLKWYIYWNKGCNAEIIEY